MKVDDKKTASQIERVSTPPSQENPAAAAAPTDKVSIGQSHAASVVVDSARRHAAASRGERLKDIEAAVRSGQYKPDPSKVAEEILNAAEVDAKVRALFSTE